MFPEEQEKAFWLFLVVALIIAAVLSI